MVDEYPSPPYPARGSTPWDLDLKEYIDQPDHWLRSRIDEVDVEGKAYTDEKVASSTAGSSTDAGIAFYVSPDTATDNALSTLLNDPSSVFGQMFRDRAVHKTGDETVGGIKTFTDGLKVGDGGWRLVQYPDSDTVMVQGDTYLAGKFGVNGEGSPRIPAVITSTIDGAALEDTQLANKVAFGVNVLFKGGYSREAAWGAPDPGFLFGSNFFVTTGTTAGDLAGVTDLFGTLHEVHNYTPNSNLNVLLGAQSEGNNEGVGSTVLSGYSHRVKGYAARHGVTVNAISLHVGSPYTENEGTITGVNEALHVGGTAPSYFGGNVSLDNRTLDVGITSSAIVRGAYLVASPDRAKVQQAAITAYAPTDASVGLIVVGNSNTQTSDLQRWQTAGGVIKSKVDKNGTGTFNALKGAYFDETDGVGVKVTQNGAANPALRVVAAASPTANLTSWLNSANGELFSITASGAPRWATSALQQTTVGAAGAASALPATPTKYLKVVDSTGATLVIPAYAS